MLTIIFFVIILVLVYCLFCIDKSQDNFQSRIGMVLISFLERILPKQLRKFVDKVIDYTVNKPNPIVQVI
jgi:hypothetical protein